MSEGQEQRVICHGSIDVQGNIAKGDNHLERADMKKIPYSQIKNCLHYALTKMLSTGCTHPPTDGATNRRRHHRQRMKSVSYCTSSIQNSSATHRSNWKDTRPITQTLSSPDQGIAAFSERHKQRCEHLAHHRLRLDLERFGTAHYVQKPTGACLPSPTR